MCDSFLYRTHQFAFRLNRDRRYWAICGNRQIEYFVTDDFGNLKLVEMPL